MIDQDEMDAYEEWKAAKLAGHTDISVRAWNQEQEALALAWEDGVKRALREEVGFDKDNEYEFKLMRILAQSPHRKPGMTGFQKPKEPVEGPHSRACGINRHDHGSECSHNCPTCHGTHRITS